LPELVDRAGEDVEGFLDRAGLVFSTDEKEDIQKAISKVPLVDMQFDFVTVEKSEAPNQFWVEGYDEEQDQPKVKHLPLVGGSAASLIVGLERVNKASSIKCEIMHFPRPKDNGWVLIVA
jgi:hypothetical protein